MIDLDLWFPQDFDKRYAKYRDEHTEKKMPDPFLVDRLENEQKHLLSINNEEDFQHEIDKWIETGDRMFDFIENAKFKFQNSSPEIKRSILSTLGSDLTLKGKKSQCFHREIALTANKESQNQ